MIFFNNYIIRTARTIMAYNNSVEKMKKIILINMKIQLLTFIIILLSAPCQPQSNEQKLNGIFTNTYWSPIISKGDNRPDFDRKKDNIDRFLVSLYYGIPAGEFMKKSGWTQEMYDSKVQFLEEKGWLKVKDNKLVPTVFIVSGVVGNQLYKFAKPISESIARSIEESIPSIIAKFKDEKLDNQYNFDEMSFLILSDVLLDNWQIMEMESSFLKQENRPERHGKFYYAAIMENSGNGYEPFRIYGNQSGKINNTTWVNIYGNNRIVANEKLANKHFQDSILANCLHTSPQLYMYFEEIAADFRPKLLKIVEENRDYSMKVFRETGYADQIRFEEFFIWWYHFIYTEATNLLVEKKILKVPETGNFYYL